MDFAIFNISKARGHLSSSSLGGCLIPKLTENGRSRQRHNLVVSCSPMIANGLLVNAIITVHLPQSTGFTRSHKVSFPLGLGE